jgi:glycosyltransferase involved in cell wall biosynthesis
MDLSIIVPTYNASKTVNETLISLEKIILHCSGKLIVVDDGSTDDTVILIQKWENKLNDKLIFLRHKKNLGGGAARNTGINAAETTYVLVCDSDDISDFESVKKLYYTASNHEWGSAHYQFARYFRKKIKNVDSTDNYSLIFNSNEISLKKALANSLLVNFLFKKENWVKAGMYPEHHGWDTQGFSIRYLLNNPGVLVVPDTFYYHRRFSGNLSYYEREALSGRTLLNNWLTAEELIGNVPNYWFDNLINSPILSCKSTLQLIKENLERMDLEIPSNHHLNEGNSDEHAFLNAINKQKEGNYTDANKILASLLNSINPSEIILFAFIRSIFLKSSNSIKISNNLAYEFLQNIGKVQQEIPTSRLKLIKEIFNKTF